MSSSFFVPVSSEEPFQIPHNHWNLATERLWRNLPLTCGPGRERNPFLHPWKTSVEWDYSTGHFVCSVRPGFVRGDDVEVAVPKWYASEHTNERLGLSPSVPESGTPSPGDKVSAFLAEMPVIPIYNDTWVSSVNSDGRSETGFSVPAYFLEQGVPVSQSLVRDPLMGTLSWRENGFVEAPRRRLLKSVDITLFQPRPTVDVFFSPSGLAGVPLLSVAMDWSNLHDSTPSLEVERVSSAEATLDINPTALDVLTGGNAPPLFDYLHIARIWLMGPQGEDGSDEVTELWTPVVQHKVFWNVDHFIASRVGTFQTNLLVNPAAHLVGGGFMAQRLIDEMNAANIEATNRLQNVFLRGGFWNV